MKVAGKNRYIRGGSSVSGQEEKGLFLRPYISNIASGPIPISETKDIIISGFHFDPKTEVIIPEPSIIIRQVTFVSPVLLVVNVSAGRIIGDFDILLKNAGLDSGDSGNRLLKVREAVWIDLRTTTLADLELETTTGVIVNQDRNRGLWVSGTGGFWNRGVKFTAHQWNRADNSEFSFVFTSSGFGTFMFGIGGSNIDVENLNNQAFYRAETQIYHLNSSTNSFFGGGVQQNWFQTIGANLSFNTERFYKVTFHQSGNAGTTMSLHEVDATNLDLEIRTLHTWTSSSPAADPILMPFWSAPSSPNVFITAYKIL